MNETYQAVPLVAGVLLALWFLVSWWPQIPPKRRFTLPTMDAVGWVVAVVVIFISRLISVWRGSALDVRVMVSIILVDGLLLVRLALWQRLRKDARRIVEEIRS